MRKTMSEHLSRAAEVLIEHTRVTIERCHCGWSDLGRSHAEHVARALDEAGLLATPEHDREVIEKFLRERDTPSVRIENPEFIAPLLAKAWDEGFKQGGPMHDVNYDDPDAHTRNPYERADRIEREAGESDADA